MKNKKTQVNKRYHLFHSPPLFRIAGSGGALWVQRDFPDFGDQLVPLDEFVPNLDRPHCYNSKFKTRMSLFTETWQKRRSSFEL